MRHALETFVAFNGGGTNATLVSSGHLFRSQIFAW